MVKVIGKSPEEIDKEEKIKKLEQIARETIPEARFSAARGAIIGSIETSDSSHLFFVYPDQNQISVQNPGAFDSAMRLAQEYESRGEPEFTVKKNYRE